MNSTDARNIQILEPIGAAVDKTSEILFRPFNLAKWLAIGFAAWLAYLGTGGGGGGGGGNYDLGDHGGGGFHPEFDEFKRDVVAHLPLILSIGGAVLLLILLIVVLVLWLRSRGQFIFLNSVARNSTAIADPWRRYSREGNSLFLFKLVLTFINIAAVLVFVIPLGFIAWALAETDFEFIAAGQIVIASFLVLAIFIVSLLFAAVSTLTTDFAVPIMYTQKRAVTEAWKNLLKIISAHKLTIFLYLLLVLLINIVLGIGAAAVFLFACCFCCVSCLFMIPILGGYLFKVATLPLWVWRRAYSACFLAQFGPEYDVFMNPDAPAAPAPAAPSPSGDQPFRSPEVDLT